MKYTATLILVATLMTMISCSKEDTVVPEIEETPSGEEILYYNSFENNDDLKDFMWLIPLLSDNTPEDGGDSSLVIDGGCIVPHGTLSIGPFGEDHNVVVDLMAYCVYGYASSVNISVNQDASKNDIVVSDSIWKQYQSEDTIALLANDTIRLSFFCGGLFSNPTHFDELKIIAVD